MNLIFNSLPTRTWNRLNMNESALVLEGSFENHHPQVVWDEKQVSWNPASGWDRFSAAYGLSRDVTALTEGSAAALAETAPGQKMDKPMILAYRCARGQRAVSRLVLHAAEDSRLSAVLLLDCPRENSGENVSVLQIQVEADPRARIDLYVAQLMGRDSLCLTEIGGTCADEAQVNLTRLELGGKSAYSGTNLDLLGKAASFNAEVGYHGRAGQVLDMNYVALHHGAQTNSLMEANGTLEEGSRKIFRGTIDFQQGCKGAKGTENENVLLLGDDMVNQTIPLILCKEEDVEGNHGASIGQLDQRLLFYLGTRGIPADDAQQMIARSRIQSICNKIPDEAIQNLITEFENPEVSHGAELPL